MQISLGGKYQVAQLSPEKTTSSSDIESHFKIQNSKKGAGRAARPVNSADDRWNGVVVPISDVAQNQNPNSISPSVGRHGWEDGESSSEKEVF